MKMERYRVNVSVKRKGGIRLNEGVRTETYYPEAADCRGALDKTMKENPCWLRKSTLVS